MKTPAEKANEDRFRPRKIPIKERIRGQAVAKFKRLIPIMADKIYPFVDIPKEHEFRPEVQEIYRAMSTVISRQGGTDRKKLEKLRDLSCMGMQYDDSYFYWFLDFLNELDMSKLKLPFDKKDLQFYRHRFGYKFPEEHLR